MKDKEDDLWDIAWFMSRVILGMFLHLILLLCAFALAEMVFEVAITLPDYKMARHLIAAMASVSAFAAGVSGSFAVKSLYIRWALPEVMDEVTKKIIK